MKRKNIVGNNIRTIRTRKGLTQEALALESGLSQGYINQLENGRRLYTQKSLEMIAEALSMPVINFFKDEAEKKDQEKDLAGKKHYKKELLSILNGMPDHIIDHYVTLVRLEKQILKERKG
ncbi:MAG TPA: helix-turn-helix transcriptional regulator [Smithellaceae bacterium]|nr:helix-turn-helix transcriptional regulator [Smithellaceae bacterium]